MSANLQETSAKPQLDAPFKILILGDFSGRANRDEEADGSEDIQHRRIHRVDRDNDDEVLARLGMSVTIPLTGKASPPVELTFAELDDFHPEQIFFRAAYFNSRKDTRRKLLHVGKGGQVCF
jgi:type VI secretion system protein ImpC